MADNTIDVAVRIGGDASGGEKAVKSIRQELREANQEAVALSRKFGDTSAEAVAAQKKVALLKDEMGDLKARVDALNPDAKFRAFSQSLQGVVGGFAGVQGAIGLFGTESAELEKQLLKVQSALALSEGLNAVLESKDAFKSLKVVVVDAFNAIRAGISATGIGLFVVALGTIVAYWDDIKMAISGVSEEQENLNKKTKESFDTENNKLKTLNDQDNILKLQGKTEDEILKIKQKQVEQAIKAGEISLQTQQANLKLQVAAEERNARFLKSTLDVLFIIPKTLFEVGAKAINGLIGLLNKVPGVDIKFEVPKDIVGDLNAFATSFIFDPKQVKQEGDAVIRETQATINSLKNQRAGLILEQQKGGATTGVGGVAQNAEREASEVEKINNNRLVNQQLTDEEFLANKLNTNNMLVSFDNALTAAEIANSKARAETTKLEMEAKMQALHQWMMLLGDLGNLLGENTAAGKAAAIASTTISTYEAAQAAYKSQMKIASPDAPVRAALAAGIAVARGIANVKRIMAVKVPGGRGGAGGSVPSGAGGAGGQTPRPPMTAGADIQNTQVVGTSNVNVQNQNTVKAFVVEKDITDSQDRVAKIKAAATI